MPSLVSRIKERKLAQWGLAYLAGAWALLEALGFLVGTFGWPPFVLRIVTVLAALGFFLTLVVAWYHGEQGRQRVSGPELLILALLLALGAWAVSRSAERAGEPTTAGAADVAPGETVARDLEALPGIAVLPLANRSALPEDQFFTDGFHDELLTRLQRTSGLRVISRTSVEAYRGSDRSIPEIGRELGVDYVVEGGVQRAGDRVRINLQLIDAPADVHLWAQTFNRVLTPESLFEIQTEVVERIAGELNLTLREEELQRAAKRTTADAEAYELFLRGREAWNRGDNVEAAGLWGDAAERDPDFVVAHALASQAHALLYGYLGARSAERREAARLFAERALALDPDSEDAQLAMGVYLYRVTKDFEEALRWLGRASGSLRGDFEYHRYRGYTERRMGRWQASIASLEAARSLSPRSMTVWRELGVTYLNLRRYDEAEAVLREAVALAPESSTPSGYLALVPFERNGDVRALWAWVERFGPDVRAWDLLMRAGDHGAVRSMLDEIPETGFAAPHTWFPKPLLEGWTYEAAGDGDRTREALQRAAAELEALVDADPQDERYHAALGLTYAGLGRRDEAVGEATLATELLPVEKDALHGPMQLYALAAVRARVGHRREALAILERLLTMPSRYTAATLRTDYLFTSLHDDPAFPELLAREPGRVF